MAMGMTIHLFFHLLSIYCVPGTVIDMREKSEKDKDPAFTELRDQVNDMLTCPQGRSPFRRGNIYYNSLCNFTPCHVSYRLACACMLILASGVLAFFFFKWNIVDIHSLCLFLIPSLSSPSPSTLFHLLKSCLILKAQGKSLFLYDVFSNSSSPRPGPLQTCDFWNTQSSTRVLL